MARDLPVSPAQVDGRLVEVGVAEQRVHVPWRGLLKNLALDLAHFWG